MFTTQRGSVACAGSVPVRIDQKALTLFAGLFLLLPATLLAQHAPSANDTIVLREGAPVSLRLAQTISSAHAHVGDRVQFSVLEDVNQNGVTVIRAGATAWGSVTRVRGKLPFGVPGRLSLEADSIELADGEVAPLRAGMEFRGHYHLRRMLAQVVVASLIYLPAAPVMLLTRGGDSYALKSAETTAQLATEIRIPAKPLPLAEPPQTDLETLLNSMPPRVFDGRGREGDMVNLLFVASENELKEAFEHAGWTSVDMNDRMTAWHLFCHGTHDAQLPMAHYYLFGRGQDFSFALPDPLFILSRRHHVRIWKTKYRVDNTPVWVAAATHDVSIAMHRLHLTHRIDPQVDAERDFIGDSLFGTRLVARTEYLPAQQPVFEATTTGGQSYFSDSRILLVKFAPPQSRADRNSSSPDKLQNSAASPKTAESKMPASTSRPLTPSESQSLVSQRNAGIGSAERSAP